VRVRRSVTLLLAAAAAAPTLAAPATAEPPPTPAPAGDVVTVRLGVDRSTNVTNTLVADYRFHHERGSWSVDVFWGFDFNPASNHLAAYTLMSASDPRTNLQADHLRLGDRNGVLADNTVDVKGGTLQADLRRGVVPPAQRGVHLEGLLDRRGDRCAPAAGRARTPVHAGYRSAGRPGVCRADQPAGVAGPSSG
jgi:hypothetical protein